MTASSATSPAPTPTGERIVDGAAALAVVTGPDAYVARPSTPPRPSTAGWCRPGTTRPSTCAARCGCIDDVDWLRALVGKLTDHHEQGRGRRRGRSRTPRRRTSRSSCARSSASSWWSSRCEAKAKLSQNRSAEDRAGVVAGLAGTPGEPVARAMEASTWAHSPDAWSAPRTARGRTSGRGPAAGSRRRTSRRCRSCGRWCAARPGGGGTATAGSCPRCRPAPRRSRRRPSARSGAA